MIDIIVANTADLQMLKTAFGNSLKVGPVHQVDAEKGYRLKLGDGPDGPFLSPWFPHPDSGGQTSTWMPLSEKQIVGVMQPDGDGRKGVIFRAGFSGENPAPSQDLTANVLKAFGIEVSMKDGTLAITGNVTVDGNVDFSGGHVRSNGHAIDDTHKHKDVEPGPSLSGVPE